MQSFENVPPYAAEHLVAVFVASVLHSAENVPSFAVQHAVLGLVLFVPDSAGNVPSFAVQHVVLELDVSVPDSTGNVPLFVVLEFVGHEFSFAVCDDDENRQIFVLLGFSYVQPVDVLLPLND